MNRFRKLTFQKASIFGDWVNFARSGDPNGRGLTLWPSYDSAQDELLELADQVRVQSRVNATGLDFFDAYDHSHPILAGRG